MERSAIFGTGYLTVLDRKIPQRYSECFVARPALFVVQVPHYTGAASTAVQTRLIGIAIPGVGGAM